MESVDGDAVVGIRVCPCMGHCRVIDGQNLYGFLTGGDCPVNHTLQITEIAYSETFLRAEGEYRNGYPGSFPGRKAEIYVAVTNCQGFVRIYLRIGHIAVGVVFPSYGTVFFLVIKYEFVFQREIDPACIHFYLPFRESGVTHQDGLVRIPVTQYFLVAANCQTMFVVDAGRICFYQQSFFVSFGGGTAFTVCQQGFCESRRVEILLFRQVLPTIFYAIVLL